MPIIGNEERVMRFRQTDGAGNVNRFPDSMDQNERCTGRRRCLRLLAVAPVIGCGLAAVPVEASPRPQTEINS
ncbi:MAG: hypothetical protein Q4C47_01220, partial [Planctomycetia bacterium]|nr:hypothetical protein [Planctomycetia bacterium]